MVIADKIEIRKELTRSDIQAVQNAALQGEGFLRIVIPDAVQRKECDWFFRKHRCVEHGMMTVDILPPFFSFNDLMSSCEDCHGSGIRKMAHPSILVQDATKSLRQGPFFKQVYNSQHPYWHILMYSLAQQYNFSFDRPFEELPECVQTLIFYGTHGETFPLKRPEGYEKQTPSYTAKVGDSAEFEGIVTRLNRLYNNKQQVELRESDEAYFNKYMLDVTCPSCNGTRLKPHRAFITLHDKNFYEIGNYELNELQKIVNELSYPPEKQDAVQPVLEEIRVRLATLIEIGLGYLSLNRRTDTLSGGENQRVRLAGQIGSGLIGLTYVIDEPTIGLHGADNERITRVLNRLRDQGNTVITIEHDPDIIQEAEYN